MVKMGIILKLLCVLVLVSGILPTPLDDYVNKPDATYKYFEITHYVHEDHTLYILNMTSQTWLTEDIVEKPIWWHYLTVTIPHVIRYPDAAFMFIEGGSNTNGPPTGTDNFVALTTAMAVSTGAIGADLKMIPNQPVVFKADPTHQRRSEDAIIAWTWKTFVESNGSNPEILLRMPMTKASVRALDTIADFVKKKVNNTVDKFFIAGASKRGWTTWTTAAVDKRVIAMAPIVMDLLHMVQNLHHHFRAYGGWTFAFKDYYVLNFTDHLDNPYTQAMADIIDPIAYNDRYATIPKIIVSTGGDEFFLPDDSHYYFNELQGPKYLRILPNAEHSCAGHEISLLFTMRAFFLSVITKTTLPKFTWVREETPTGGRITIMSDQKPKTVNMYYATTLDGERRDFRLLVGTPGDPSKPLPHPVIWLRDDVKDMGNNTYVAEIDKPFVGWTAFFVQVTFPGVADSVLEFTTETQIVPDIFPFPDCQGASCLGVLV
ncbi:autocrine proliferation repressor protein A [Patella vulgata]|uniref:autocrine proliferation repressor protein A n=1 Tax=Patella vulgata TaxID=6465 RepID=UPI00217FA9D5|nr:autocrine proliferation repressor protein A [Patella vulgata]